MEFLDRHLPEIVVIGIFIVTSIGALMIWRFKQLEDKISGIGQDMRNSIDELDDEFRDFRKTVYRKFDEGFEQHKEFEGRVSFIEGKTNGKPR